MQERQTKQKQIIYDALKTLDHPTATDVYLEIKEKQYKVSAGQTVDLIYTNKSTNRSNSEDKKRNEKWLRSSHRQGKCREEYAD